MKEAQGQLFKSSSATFEQTVEEGFRGAEENYFNILRHTIAVFPWFEGPNEKLQRRVDQDIAVASEFAHRLMQAKDFQDLARIESEFIQTCCNVLATKKRYRRRMPKLRQTRPRSPPIADGSPL
jgi:hypothetical protein